jgi:hypothetical protein
LLRGVAGSGDNGSPARTGDASERVSIAVAAKSLVIPSLWPRDG